jgi:multiple sugar transport system permease protein
MEGFDGRGALATAERKANDGLMYPRTEERMRRYRPWGWGGLAVLAIALTALGVAMLRALRDRAAETAAPAQAAVRIGSRRIAWTPLLLLAPALALIAMWKYYPLLRGGLMAFQDYRLSGESRWVGADNFIAVFLDPGFWVSVRQTFKFVLLSLALGFVTPVFLALLLTEVPRLKILFRTLFFLPQVSSGLVILFLWKLFYNPTPDGLLNRLLGLSPPVDWLGDPRWTMLAVILPGVWAGAGMGSLIYQAALRTIPPDLYEAAAVDGAGVFRNLRHITLPQLAPLLVINFVGVFIGTFHAMGNIFALTAGGPGNETMVLSLAIWYEAFAFLRFGTATAMAWVLGSILVGFTLMQLRLLRRVEFRRTEEA